MHTRGNVVEKEKEKFLAMTIEERRNLYKCGSNYVTLPDVKTWSQTFKEMPDRKAKKTGKRKYEVNTKLNEKVSIWRGDITKLEIDAIVNAANNRLLGGGGVDGAIHFAAGSSLTAECATLNGCQTGDAKITLGYKLPASRVIHTVGPMGENSSKLRSCYKRCLQLVQDDKLKSVAFPCISTGIYGYPNRNAAEIALETTREWLEKDDNAEKTERVIFCLFLEVDVNIYEELMQEYFPVAEVDEKKSDEASKEVNSKEMSDEKKSSENPEKKVNSKEMSDEEKSSENPEKKGESEKVEKIEAEKVEAKPEETDNKDKSSDASADKAKEPKEEDAEKLPQTKL